MAQHIKNLFASLIPYCDPWKINLIENWQTVLGDLHEHVAIINIQNTMLILGVYDAAWLQELYILSPVLVKTINDYLGSTYVTQVRFKNIGYKRKQRNIAKPFSNKNLHLKLTPLLSLQEQEALLTIKESELREVLERYLIRCKER